MVLAQYVQPSCCRQEEVTTFMKCGIGVLAVDFQGFTKTAQELCAEHRHLDIFGRGELVADGRRRQGRGTVLVAGVLFYHRQASCEIRVGCEKVSSGAADGGASGYDDIVTILRHCLGSSWVLLAKRFCCGSLSAGGACPE